MTTCTQCFGTKLLDDLGYPCDGTRQRKPSQEGWAMWVDCSRCGGTGEEPGNVLLRTPSAREEREAELALDRLEELAR